LTEQNRLGRYFNGGTVEGMNSSVLKLIAMSVTASAMLVFAPHGGPFSSTALAASCNSLAKDFKRRGNPRFLRVVNRNRSIANYFNSTLRRLQSDDVPTTAEMRKAYRVTAKSCSSGKCRADAKSIYNAALKLHAYNRRWARSGCSGTLN
jgi:hypothetical protein